MRKTSMGTGMGKRKRGACVAGGNGKVPGRGQYPNTRDGAAKFAGVMARRYLGGGPCRAARGTTGNMRDRTFDAFEAAGTGIKLANTYRTALIARTAKKTDRIDAEKIAQVPGTDMIPERCVPPGHTRGMRAMAGQRVRLARDRARVTSRARSLPGRHDIQMDAPAMHSEKALGQLESAGPGSGHDGLVLGQCARQAGHLTEEISVTGGLPGTGAAHNGDARLPASTAGVGTFTAVLMAPGIGDVSRFRGPRQMVSWAGLCPAACQSGNQPYAGRIKKIDPGSLVNWAMREAADTAVRHDARMEAVYASARRRHADKHGPATMVVAHKMVTMMRHMPATKAPYESRNEGPCRRKLAGTGKARRGRPPALPASRTVLPALAMNPMPCNPVTDRKNRWMHCGNYA